MKRVLGVLFSLAAVLLVADPALAQEAVREAAASNAASVKVWYFVAIVVTSGFAMAMAASFCAIAQSRAVTTAVDGIARQPSAAGQIFTPMIIGLALIESLALYVLVIAILLFFVNPFNEMVLGL